MPERFSSSDRRVHRRLLEAIDESERAAVVDQFERDGFEELRAETDGTSTSEIER